MRGNRHGVQLTDNKWFWRIGTSSVLVVPQARRAGKGGNAGGRAALVPDGSRRF